MIRASATRSGHIATLTATLVIATTSLSACATASCPAVAIADNFLVTTASAAHQHPLLSICESTTCTPPVNASSADRGTSLDATPRLAVYATAVDHWRVSVLESKPVATTTDPSSVGIVLFDRTKAIAKRTVHLKWHPAAGTCSNFKTANAVHISLP